MSFFTPGTASINSGAPAVGSTLGSTAGIATNPSTSVMIAEVDSTQLSILRAGGHNCQVTWVLGASTLAIWQLEQTLSTGIDISTSGRDLIFVQTPTGQSGQYVTKHRIVSGDRLRARLQTAITGVATAKIQVEPLDG